MARATQVTVPEFDIRDRLTKAARTEAERRGLPSVEALVAEVAEACGVSRSGLYKWLAGRLPQRTYWRAISLLAAQFHVPPEWLDAGEVWEPGDPRRDRIAELAEMEGLADPRLLTIGAEPAPVARKRRPDQGSRQRTWDGKSAGRLAAAGAA